MKKGVDMFVVFLRIFVSLRDPYVIGSIFNHHGTVEFVREEINGSMALISLC